MIGRNLPSSALALCLLVLAACAPTLPQSGTLSPSGLSESQAARKNLTVGVQREPTDLGVLFGQGTATTAGGAGSVKVMVHDKLAVEMELDRWQPQLARELPALDRGTWQLNPDGSMDTTWLLRPNVRWHDGE